MRIPSLRTVIASVAIAFGESQVVIAQPQLFDGAYKGILECEEGGSNAAVISGPLMITITNGRVYASMPPLLESVATGRVREDGALHFAYTIYTRSFTRRVHRVTRRH